MHLVAFCGIVYYGNISQSAAIGLSCVVNMWRSSDFLSLSVAHAWFSVSLPRRTSKSRLWTTENQVNIVS